MAKATPHRLTDLMPERRKSNDDILAEIEGKEVTITALEIKDKVGRNGTYKVTHVTLADGTRFTVAGSAVANPLSYVEEGDLPIGACFTRSESDFEPGTYYWTVN